MGVRPEGGTHQDIAVTVPRESDLERIARILGTAGRLGLGTATRDLIGRKLLDERGDPSPLQQVVRPGKDAADGAATARTEAPSADHDPAVLKIRLRHMVEAGGGWADLKPVLEKLLLDNPRDDHLAFAAEMATLFAANDELVNWLEELILTGPSFFLAVQADLRRYLLHRLWDHEGGKSVLSRLVMAPGAASHLIPLEKLFVLFAMRDAGDLAGCFGYFRTEEEDLFSAVARDGSLAGCTPDGLRVTMGRMALDLEYEILARGILEKVNRQAPEYQEAARLLLSFRIERDEEGHCIYGRRLSRTKDPHHRLKLFYEFLSEARSKEGLRDRNRPALNEVLRQPMRWFEDTPDQLAAVSRMLVTNRDLATSLPALYALFRENACRFHGAKRDQALWSAVAAPNPEYQEDTCWRGVALFHQYLTDSSMGEAVLWQARAGILGTKQSPVKWQDLLAAGRVWVARTPALDERRRRKLLSQIQVAADPGQLAADDMMSYLEANPQPPPAVLKQLLSVARLKSDDRLEHHLLEHKSRNSLYTNDDLRAIWDLAVRWKQTDLAWRVATVLSTREALHERVVHAWQVSGENRRSYPVRGIGPEMLTGLYGDLPADQRKICENLLKIGPRLPALLAIGDKSLRSGRLPVSGPGEPGYLIDQALAPMAWLHQNQKEWRLAGAGLHGAGRQPPGFINARGGLWEQLWVRLGERLGFHTWGWKFSLLSPVLDELLPGASRAMEGKGFSRLGRWLRSLSPDQRKAWYQLSPALKNLGDDEGTDLLVIMVNRIALLMVQDHFRALKSLQESRAPLPVLRSLEGFILSRTYTRMREQSGTLARVPIPVNLQNLPHILR